MTQNTSQQIVVISQEDDPHIPHVQSHLACPLIVLDRATILQGHPQAMLYNRADKRFEVLDGHLLLDKVTAVWFRKPIRNDQLELPVAKALQRYVQFAFNEYSQLLYRRFQDALWISNFDAIRRASDKLLQLELASRLGFNVPETLVTSSPAAAKHFVASHLPCISKPIECEGFVKGEQMYYFFTNKVNEATDFSGLPLAPAIFQEAIEDALDIRVTVVGNKVFAASIRGKNIDKKGSTIRDWRITNYDKDVVYEAFSLPPAVSDLCVRHAVELGLVYSAIDLVLDKKGKFWFLENNPNGQWAFIEEATKQPIGKAIADRLALG